MRKAIFHILLFCVLCVLKGIGQDLSFTNYSTKEGLSSAQVYQIMQDINGDMLFSTDRGITKYDGTDFETFGLDDGLTNTTVFNFFPQEDGKIWCSTIDNSWFYFQNGTTRFILCDQNELIKKNSTGGLVQDLWISKTGDMYFGFEEVQDYLKINSPQNKVIHPLEPMLEDYDTLQVIFVEKENGSMFRYFRRQEEVPNEWENGVKMIVRQSKEKIGYKRTEYINGRYLFSSDKYLIIQKDQYNKFEMQFESRVIGMGQYDSDHFWVGLYDGGLRIFDMAGNEKHHWLKNKSATYLYTDNHGGIWISTLSNGVYYAQNDNIKQYDTQGNSFIFSLSPGKDGEPVVSTLGKHFQVEKNSLKLTSSESQILSQRVLYDALTENYRAKLYNAEILAKNKIGDGAAIIDFSENNDSTLVVASPFRFYVQTPTGFFEYNHPSRITAIEIADSGYLIGEYSGLSYVKNESLAIEKLNFPESNGRIKDIKRKGRYHFIATNENGLVRWQENGNQTLNITRAQGLASNLVNEVFAESESTIWVATNKGLDRVIFNGDEFNIKHFGVEHGLLDNDVTDVYVFRDVVWIGTRSGLCSITKSQFDEVSKSIAVNLFWKQLKINGIDTVMALDLDFSHAENNLEFTFHSAFYGGPSRVKYRYKIDDESDNWFELNSRKILLNNLKYGEYNLIVQANVDNTNWTDNQIILPFRIAPPFYQTWWFRGILMLAIGVLIYLFFKLRVLIYNRSLVKEALRLIIRKLNPKQKTFVILEQGASHRINSNDVLFFNSYGNYLTIQLKDKKHVIRYKIGDFSELVPDKLEYLRVHKSYVVRLDKISSKNIDTIFIEGYEIPIGKTYKAESKIIDDFIFEKK